ncbi:MAG TPA: hypothetical protein VIA62_08335 [Thermoanaerobaculia bacterium]|jgi:hypothetical protein|nr:hypothetical protein [Thermoanaerobaculia bacterium]
MKSKARRKLSLSLETLHRLDREHLKAAAAYNYSTSPDICPTHSCPTACPTQCGNC